MIMSLCEKVLESNQELRDEIAEILRKPNREGISTARMKNKEQLWLHEVL